MPVADTDPNADAPSGTNTRPSAEDAGGALAAELANGFDEYVNNAVLFGMKGDDPWVYGNWWSDDKAACRNDLLAITDLQAGASTCQQLILPSPTLTAGEGQCCQQQVTSLLFVDDTLYALVEECLIDHVQDDSEDYYMAAFAPLQTSFSLCSADGQGVLQRLCTLQLPQALQPTSDAIVRSPPGCMQAGPDGSFWLTFYRLEDPFGWAATSCYLTQAAPDGVCRGCTKLADALGAEPLRLSADSMVYPFFDDTDGQARLALVTGLSAGKPQTDLQTVGSRSCSAVIQSATDEAEVLLWDTEGVFCWDATRQTSESWLRWRDCGLTGEQIFRLRAVYALGEDELLLAFSADGHDLSLRRVKRAAAQSDDSAVVTLAVFMDYHKTLETAVINYNYTNPAVQIEIVEYDDDTAQSMGYASGWEMLMDDILHNTAPDILQLSAPMNPPNLISKGLFIDLYPYLDADEELTRADFVPGALQACEFQGALPSIMLSYWLDTAVVSADVLDPDTTAWTLQQFMALSDGYATPVFPYGRGTVLLHYLLENYIDFEENRCQIAGSSFVDLLQQSNSWKPDYTDDTTLDPKQRITDGEVLVYRTLFSTFDKLEIFRYLFDGDFAIAGVPTDAGSGSRFSADLQLGITRYCADPDAAWQFVRTLLLPSCQNTLRYSFPIRQDALQAQAQAARQPVASFDALPALPPYIRYADLSDAAMDYWLQGCQQQDVDRLLAAIQSADYIFFYDEPIDNILEEELAAYYSGQYTAEETAEILQNRIQTYLDEQG